LVAPGRLRICADPFRAIVALGDSGGVSPDGWVESAGVAYFDLVAVLAEDVQSALHGVFGDVLGDDHPGDGAHEAMIFIQRQDALELFKPCQVAVDVFLVVVRVQGGPLVA
jgi:hypothetical protein